MKNTSIASLEESISRMRKQLAVTTAPDEKAELEEKIDFTMDDIDEIEAHDRDCAAEDEYTGNTAQDRYLDQNHYAIAQSERYEQFRNEY